MPATPQQIADAIARVPGQSNEAIKRVLDNARAQSAQNLVHACEDELTKRGSLVLSDKDAQQALITQAKVQDRSLQEIIVMAFQDPSPFPEEGWIISKLIVCPGIRFADLETAYKSRFGKNDLSLTVGHLVYNRFGYFRHVIRGDRLSDVLIQRGQEDGLTYRFRAEALAAFQALAPS